MSIRLIAADLDGTLLTSQKTIDARTAAALAQAAQKGIALAFATGRTGVETDSLRALAPQVRYAVLCNGAFVRDLDTGALLAEEALPMETARTVLRRVAEAGVPEGAAFYEAYMPELFCAEEILTDARCIPRAAKAEYGLTPALAKLLPRTRTPLADFPAAAHARTQPVGKVNFWFDTPARRDAVLARVDDLPCTITHQEKTNLEFNRLGVDKGLGLAHLARALGLSREEVMAFGDNDNDVAMLRWAGCGVAMAGAPRYVQEAARFVTEGNDDAGVGKGVERWAL